ncbi:ribbon-helix-helix protein, CopG family [Candidatus Pacearchaeota archaeon]|nr:ribbon-helix-helix protein, CopG family [Candidatus Pacearchaeota archaeon]
MENVSLKLEPQFLKEIENIMKKNRYMTKTEFIREAIRDKLIELEKQNMLKHLDKIAGSSKHKTTDEDLHRARERLVKKYEERFK